nr:unnamed protein product [Callosobruchus chinensis]
MIGDNSCHRFAINVIEQCENVTIKFILLPTNTTDLLQPLDVSYFRPLKNAWRKVLTNRKIKRRGKHVSEHNNLDFGIPFPMTLADSVSPKGITAGNI